MYKLLISVRTAKQLKNISRTYQQEAVVSALEELRENPLIGRPLTRELTGRFSLKVGVYRIIYKVNDKDKTIQIIAAGHRATIYK